MRTLVILIAALFYGQSALSGTGDVITCAADLAKETFVNAAIGSRFDFIAKLTTPGSPNSRSLAVEDDSGAMILYNEHGDHSNFSAASGEIVRVSGKIAIGRRSRRAYADCDLIASVGHTAPVPPRTVTATELLSGDFDCRPVRLRGTVRDVADDEIDPNYIFLILNCDGEMIYVPNSSTAGNREKLNALIGATIEIGGVCAPSYLGGRRQIGRLLQPYGADSLTVINPPGADPFDVPEIRDFTKMRPPEIAALGRHKASGRVIAVWHGDSLLLKTADGKTCRVELAENNPPRFGDCIEAVGFPESDLYRINLTRAIWRPAHKAFDANPDPARTVTIESLMTDTDGRLRFDPYAHGKTIRIRGMVRTIPARGNDDGRLNLECGKFIIPVDVSANPDVTEGVNVGCEIEVTGTCIMESENWRPNLVFPKIKQMVVVVRQSGDIRILTTPPWWTPGKLLIVIGTLLIALLAILIWNAALRTLAERRGRQLFKSQIAKVESGLRVDERTRLAVELHDSITQNLTGVTFQLDAAASARPFDPAAADRHLITARRILQSCLDELRRCLWDLRSEALEERNFNQAIRITLQQVVCKADIGIRFNVNRARLQDATAHAVLRIVRELVTNAICHGKATRVRVAGEMLPEKLHFAVSDNGTGFDPSIAPGPDQGHFGLVGIRERIKNLNGRFEIEAAPGRGTRAKISINLPHKQASNEDVA